MGCIGSIPAADNFLVPEVTFQASGGGLMPGLGDDASLVLRYGNTIFFDFLRLNVLDFLKVHKS